MATAPIFSSSPGLTIAGRPARIIRARDFDRKFPAAPGHSACVGETESQRAESDFE